MDNFLTTVVMLIGLGIVFYLFLLRPQQKRAKAQQEKMNSINVGVRVMLTSGILGTVRHRGEKQMILEVAPGFEITVVRQAIMRVVDPDEDEFEYEDEDALAIQAGLAGDAVAEPSNEEIAEFFENEASNRDSASDSADPDDEIDLPESDSQTK